ncbi:glutathione synthetase ATP-binding domain-like protein [Zopfia rhizophila CBS 207.26]|uniref:Glutathione synthetase ATP-binding domain-like protein n=1 Tax=Zopfia rhizophila CBS 207.26 TaxID=1314779 RepID=A0A6A6DVJ4_9PEZI|nr:glutathione synthetase ATP-binding domain-like protein [Zopfia rhizophila CBS 207.26]
MSCPALSSIPRSAQRSLAPKCRSYPRFRHRVLHRFYSSRVNGIAVLFQALEPPIINGVQKPKKPGGYRDSGADIAYVLKHKCNINVVTPTTSPNPASDGDWCFPDHEEGIVAAAEKGTTHLWANTILFAAHPLETSKALDAYEDSIYVVGQPPKLVEAYDDKALVYNIMKSHGNLTLPKSLTVEPSDDVYAVLQKEALQYPLIAKPVRGRGSHGVKLCSNEGELQEHVQSLFTESPKIIVEEYLSGEEATVTVMPPSTSRPQYWAMPVATRFNHIAGIAPYNGVVAVTTNSRVIGESEAARDPAYKQVADECELVARLLDVKAPIRIDVRRFSNDSPFALFDNMTGPGRPGREDQASLTAIAAKALGWDYGKLLKEILASASSLRALRNAGLPTRGVR